MPTSNVKNLGTLKKRQMYLGIDLNGIEMQKITEAWENALETWDRGEKSGAMPGEFELLAEDLLSRLSKDLNQSDQSGGIKGVWWKE